MNKTARILLCSLIASRMTLAQDSPPPAPIVTTPTLAMEWSMTLESDDAAKTGVLPRPWDAVAWSYIHTGNLTKIVVAYGQNTTRQYWRLPHVTLCQNILLHKVDVVTDGPLPVFPCASDGFYGLENVKSGDDQGVAMFESSSAHYFRGDRSPKPMANPTLPPPKLASTNNSYEAWFDLKTGLPKAYRVGNKTYLYSFSESVPAALQLPPEYEAALDQFRINMRKIGLPVNF